MDIDLRTLTPVWTGGAEAGKVDRLHETGIIGSLRWWMEAMVRGVGGEVSDPTGDKRSLLELKKYGDGGPKDAARLREAGLCDVSQVFGATGWRRRFRLDIQDQTAPAESVALTIKAQRSYTDGSGKERIPTWYFQSKPRTGRFRVSIQSLDPSFRPEVMAGLIQFLADWAAIGARPQMGFGVVEPVEGRIQTMPLYDWLAGRTGQKAYPSLPSLENIFLARIIGHGASDQDTFNLKYDLRRLFTGDTDLRHFIMGTVKGDRIASKVKVSRPYSAKTNEVAAKGNLIRVWGWVPQRSGFYKGGWSRESVLQTIHDHIAPDLLVWREMNSTRDTVAKDCGDPLAFARDLLGL